MDRLPDTPEEIQFHLDRLDAWFVELWSVANIDLHMSDGTKRTGQSGLLSDIRDDVRVLRAELAKRMR